MIPDSMPIHNTVLATSSWQADRLGQTHGLYMLCDWVSLTESERVVDRQTDEYFYRSQKLM